MNDSYKENDPLLQVAAFYCFSPLDDAVISSLLTDLISIAKEFDVRGSVLVAEEGVNGTICGSNKGIATLLKRLMNSIHSSPLEIKFSWTKKQAFRKFKSRKKDEIVTMGVTNVDPLAVSGNYVEPKHWNNFLEDPNVLVIDTRNEYEVAIGTFPGSVNPHTDIFRDFPSWVDQHLKLLVNEKQTKKIGMFCTGGIRCEKASSYLMEHGFPEVYHLHGGILRYLEEIPETASLWQGECFVFDQRVALNHDLVPGMHKLCYACGMPLSPIDRDKPEYIFGIQCHHCINSFSDDDRARFAERQKYIHELSKRRPENSLWPSA